jgi:hypothetical protein
MAASYIMQLCDNKYKVCNNDCIISVSLNKDPIYNIDIEVENMTYKLCPKCKDFGKHTLYISWLNKRPKNNVCSDARTHNFIVWLNEV